MFCVDYQRCEKSYVLRWLRLMRHISLSLQSIARGNVLFAPVVSWDAFDSFRDTVVGMRLS